MTTTPYSAENVAELALKNGAAFMGDADHMTMHISTLAAIINAALEQQAAARRVLASKPHPTGDTQQEAVGEVEWAGTGWTGSPNVQVKLYSKLPAGTKLFTHPPEATALAQEVIDALRNLKSDYQQRADSANSPDVLKQEYAKVVVVQKCIIEAQAVITSSEDHECYTSSDADAPDCIKNCHGEVVLSMCRKCGQGESDLENPCTPDTAAQAKKVKKLAVAIVSDFFAMSQDDYIDKYGVATPGRAIAAIPIHEPRPDALVAMAYRKAAEAVRNVYAKKTQTPDEAGTLSDAALAVESLTPPDAQAALEELVGALDLALLTLANYFETTRHMPELSSLDDNASKIREVARKYGSKL